MLMMSGDLLTIGSSSASASGNTSPQGGPATAAASGDHELGEVASSFGKHPGKPLQKGLACISCKAGSLAQRSSVQRELRVLTRHLSFIRQV
mgnify:FL=1|jgi:hypothetical protein